MINPDVFSKLPEHVQIKTQIAICTPEFLALIQAHIEFFNYQLAFLNPEDAELKHNYRTLRTQRDNWLNLQEIIVRLLTDNPGLQTQAQ